jgi:hypothetical protein
MKLLLFIFLSLPAAQGYRYIPVPMPEIRDLMRIEDRDEYYSLYYACKTIRDTQCVIRDRRMTLGSAIESSITLYLKRIDSLAAKVLLRDLQNKEFRME